MANTVILTVRAVKDSNTLVSSKDGKKFTAIRVALNQGKRSAFMDVYLDGEHKVEKGQPLLIVGELGIDKNGNLIIRAHEIK